MPNSRMNLLVGATGTHNRLKIDPKPVTPRETLFTSLVAGFWSDVNPLRLTNRAVAFKGFVFIFEPKQSL